MTYWAIKPVYDRKTKTYSAEVLSGGGEIIGLVHRGYYITDSLAAMLGRITVGKCEWFNKLSHEKRVAISHWLHNNV